MNDKENNQKIVLTSLYSKVILTNGKIPQKSCKYSTLEDREKLTDVEVFDGDNENSFAFLLAPNAILLDADTETSSETLKNIIEGENIACRMMQTLGNHKGIHATFLDNVGLYDKSGTNITLALGIVVDIKLGSKNGLEMQKLNGVYYPILKNRIGEIPKFFKAIKGGQDLSNIDVGGRNDALFKHFMSLSRNGFTFEDAKKIILLANKYILGYRGMSLEEAEIEKTIFSSVNKERFESEKNCNFRQDLSQDILEKYLLSKNITVKYNELTSSLCFFNIPKDWDKINQNKHYTIKILDDLKALGVKRVTEKLINSYLDVIGDENTFHPVFDWLQSEKWNGKSYLHMIYESLHLDEMQDKQRNELSKILVKKWLIQCIAMLYNKQDDYIGAEGVLVLTGKEGIGKTRFFQNLTPVQSWFKSISREINLSNRDDVTRALSGWICEISEIDATLQRKRSDLKSFITSSEETLRLAYDARQISIIRKTSFAGTTNKDRFLNDESGSRRFWCIPIEKIDINKLPKGEELKQLWLEILNYYLEDKNSFRLTDIERECLRRYNLENNELLPAVQELLEHFNFEAERSKWSYRTSTQVRDLFFMQLNRYQLTDIGKALTQLNKFNDNVVSKKTNRGRVYFTPPAISRWE